MKNIGKPCAGEPHARFDEGGQARACSLLYPLAVALAVVAPLAVGPFSRSAVPGPDPAMAGLRVAGRMGYVEAGQAGVQARYGEIGGRPRRGRR